MKVRVHIERLVLDGLPVDRLHGGLVRAAVEAELERLLAEQGVGALSGGAVDRVSGGVIEVGGGAAELGGRIARAVHGSLSS